jgi:dipeptidyl aminopeptidase/acylaminoacyl peptidase
MHDDLVDGVRWAVASGKVDPAKVAIWGASYGGYSALVGATFTPEVFACAVDFVGVSHLARLLETVPPYWELGLPWWHRYVGDPANPEQRKIMDSKSPVFKADQATKPILIMQGINDPRVKLEQSDLMVAALKKAGKQVDYVTFKGDGHGNQKWNNNLTMYRKTEDFFATCLGGRSSGFDYYELAAWAF